MTKKCFYLVIDASWKVIWEQTIGLRSALEDILFDNLKYVACEGRLREIGLFILKERWLWSYVIAACPYLQGSCWEGGASLFIVMCGGRMRENRHKALMGFKEKFFHHEYSKAVDQVAQRPCKGSILGVFQDIMDKTLSNLVWAWHWPYFEQEVGVKTSWSSFHLNFSMLLWLCDSIICHEVFRYHGPGKQEHASLCLIWSQILWKQPTSLCRKQSGSLAKGH